MARSDQAYNESWFNNYSQSGWRVIDGSQLFANPVSLIVVSRTIVPKDGS